MNSHKSVRKQNKIRNKRSKAVLKQCLKRATRYEGISTNSTLLQSLCLHNLILEEGSAPKCSEMKFNWYISLDLPKFSMKCTHVHVTAVGNSYSVHITARPFPKVKHARDNVPRLQLSASTLLNRDNISEMIKTLQSHKTKRHGYDQEYWGNVSLLLALFGQVQNELQQAFASVQVLPR